MIRILIGEDSQTITSLLKHIFSKEADMQVVGTAADGREVVKLANELKPNLITMDIRMPVMDGFQATRMVMATNPIPIVVVSSTVSDREMKTTFRAIEEGALAVMEKPPGPTTAEFESYCRKLVRTVRSMAEVKLITRKARVPTEQISTIQLFGEPLETENLLYELVAFGCSTGGPQALASIFTSIPADFPIPIVVAQHISNGFIVGMAKWLNETTLVNVSVASNRQALLPGNVYFAPDDRHLEVMRGPEGLMASLTDDPRIGGFRPSANPLLSSVARVSGARGIGVILSGMGSDGATGMLDLHKARGVTFVQDEQSSIIFSMPRSALEIGAASEAVALGEISGRLLNLVRKKDRQTRMIK